MKKRPREIIIRNIVKDSYLDIYVNEKDYENIIFTNKDSLNFIDELKEFELRYLNKNIDEDDIILLMHYTGSRCRNFDEGFLFVIKEDLQKSWIYDIEYDNEDYNVNRLHIESSNKRELIHGLYYDRLKREYYVDID